MDKFNHNQRRGFSYLGYLAAHYQDDLLALLHNYGWELDRAIPAKSLVGVLLEELSRNSVDFLHDLAKILSGANFTGDKAELVIGADPISVVAGALNSVATLAGTAMNRKHIKRAAQLATINAILQPKAALEDEQKPKNPPKTKSRVRPWVIGGGILLGVGILITLSISS